MAETLTAVPEPTQVNEPTNRLPETTISGEHFAGAFFGEDIQKPVIPQEQIPQQPANEPSKEEIKKEQEEEILEPSAWLKSKWGWESEEAADAEIKELRELKGKTPQEIKFANEQSKQLHELIREGKTKEVRDFLERHERLEKYTAAEVNDETAADIIKFGMQLKYKNLSPSEIEYKYNKQYGIPSEPRQGADELDDEFATRKAAWQEQVNAIKMDRNIEAKLMLPELEQQKAQLVLPKISEEATQSKQPTQEELAAFEKEKTSFLQSSEKMISDFNGFSVQVKDKDVDYAVGYSPSKEEKQLVATKFKEFAESGFNANVLFAQRWVNEDGTINVNLMLKDYMKVITDDKANQKLVNDAAAQRLELYLKEKKNININETRQTGIPENKKEESQILQEKFWGN